jgi:hypothetical protein
MSVEIITGDCREVLPGIRHADVLITDPVWPNCPDNLLEGWERPEALLREALEVAPDSLKRIVIVMRSDSDPRFLRAVPDRWPFFNAHWLQYAIPSYIGRKLGGNEIAYAFGEPVLSAKGRRLVPSIAPKAQPRDRLPNGHPCSRALCHFDWLVQWWSEPGETILDPFAGSGTTGIAADRQGRNAVLIEKDPKYADLARHRLAEHAPLLRGAS